MWKVIERLKKSVRVSKFFNKIYYYVGSFIINIIRLFIKSQDNLILFVSFGGKHYNDSPKAIYEAMIKDKRYSNYSFVWAFIEPNKFEVPGRSTKININSLQYFLVSLRARVWISNVPVERRLNYKGKNTYYFGTWHGTPIKKLGNDVSEVYGRSKYDVLCAQGDFDVKIWQEAFNIKKENIISSGLPRNDVLKTANEETQLKFKRKLNLPTNKKVILYCPTFRDWQSNHMKIKVDFNKWEKTLGDKYIVLFRAHSMIAEKTGIDNHSGFVIDVSTYNELNDLMIASDILVSDYSSIFFDYAILNKPMFCYTYDYEEYEKKRGLYFDIRQELPGGSIPENELLTLILNMRKEEMLQKVRDFRRRYVNWSGNATSQSLDRIYDEVTK